MYVYGWVPLMPSGITTLTLKVPGVLAGTIAVICVSLTNVKHGAVPHGPRTEDPTSTEVAPVKPVPVRVTLVPPAVGPNVGLRLVNVGATNVYGWVVVVPPGVTT
jgi:hypothetical protein